MLLEILTLPFMQRALLGGALLSLISSYFGVFVISRKMSFLGSGLAHAAFGGVALGFLFDTEPLVVAIPFTILISLLITWTKNHSPLHSDAAIGIFFSCSMALGILILNYNQGETTNAMVYLFGSLLALNDLDLLIIIIFLILTFLSFPLWGKWAYATFDQQLAKSDGLKIMRDDYLLSAFISTNVVIAIKIMGILLVSAFLVIPPATARLSSKRFSIMTLNSLLIGLSSTLLGLILSYIYDLPSGASIIMFQSFIFFIFLLRNLKFY